MIKKESIIADFISEYRGVKNIEPQDVDAVIRLINTLLQCGYSIERIPARTETITGVGYR
jgi:hypothetical protein